MSSSSATPSPTGSDCTTVSPQSTDSSQYALYLSTINDVTQCKSCFSRILMPIKNYKFEYQFIRRSERQFCDEYDIPLWYLYIDHFIVKYGKQGHLKNIVNDIGNYLICENDNVLKTVQIGSLDMKHFKLKTVHSVIPFLHKGRFMCCMNIAEKGKNSKRIWWHKGREKNKFGRNDGFSEQFEFDLSHKNPKLSLYFAIFLYDNARLLMTDFNTSENRTLFLDGTVIVIEGQFRAQIGLRFSAHLYTLSKLVENELLGLIEHPIIFLSAIQPNDLTAIWDLVMDKNAYKTRKTRFAYLILPSNHNRFISRISVMEWNDGIKFVQYYQSKRDWNINITIANHNTSLPIPYEGCDYPIIKPVCIVDEGVSSLEPQILPTTTETTELVANLQPTIEELSLITKHLLLHSDQSKHFLFACFVRTNKEPKSLDIYVDHRDKDKYRFILCGINGSVKQFCDMDDRPQWYLFVDNFIYESKPGSFIITCDETEKNAPHLICDLKGQLQAYIQTTDYYVLKNYYLIHSIIPFINKGSLKCTMLITSKKEPKGRRIWWCFGEETKDYGFSEVNVIEKDSLFQAMHGIQNFGIFLCKGTRLIMHDFYGLENQNISVKYKSRNNTLFLDSTFIAIEGELRFYFGLNTSIHFDCRKLFENKLINDMSAKVNKILFLSPLTSKYGSMIWRLHIDLFHHESTLRTAYLQLPKEQDLRQIRYMEWNEGIKFVKYQQSIRDWNRNLSFENDLPPNAPYIGCEQISPNLKPFVP